MQNGMTSVIAKIKIENIFFYFEKKILEKACK